MYPSTQGLKSCPDAWPYYKSAEERSQLSAQSRESSVNLASNLCIKPHFRQRKCTEALFALVISFHLIFLLN